MLMAAAGWLATKAVIASAAHNVEFSFVAIVSILQRGQETVSSQG
jgi:hypothetical protein